MPSSTSTPSCATRPTRAACGLRSDSGDHLHPGDAGYRAMAEAIDIQPFRAHAPALSIAHRPAPQAAR
ncbi:hypothetical protein [Massilia phosphatilytica]